MPSTRVSALLGALARDVPYGWPGISARIRQHLVREGDPVRVGPHQRRGGAHGAIEPDRILRVRRVDDPRVDQIPVVALDGTVRDLESELAHHLRGGALHRAASDDRRDTDHRRPGRANRVAHSRHRQDRVDADEGVGRTHHHAAEGTVRERFEHGVARPRGLHTLELEAGHCRLAPVPHEVVLECEPPTRRLHDRAHLFVARGHYPCVHPEATRDVHADARPRLAVRESARAFDVQGEISVPEPKPGLAAEIRQRPHERPRFSGAPPAGLRVRNTGQRVEDGVGVGTDAQPQVVEVVSGVADHGERSGGKDAVQAERELCAADASGQRDRDAGVHRHRPPRRALTSRALVPGVSLHTLLAPNAIDSRWCGSSPAASALVDSRFRGNDVRRRSDPGGADGTGGRAFIERDPAPGPAPGSGPAPRSRSTAAPERGPPAPPPRLRRRRGWRPTRSGRRSRST